MTFWYHMSGPHVGTLKIKLRYQKPDEYDQVLWTLSGHQANCWKEGRVLLHKSVKHYQVSAAAVSYTDRDDASKTLLVMFHMP